jgi:hypothetical protein
MRRPVGPGQRTERRAARSFDSPTPSTAGLSPRVGATGLLVATLLLSSCWGSHAPVSAVRGTSIANFACPATSRAGPAIRISPATVTALRLCRGAIPYGTGAEVDLTSSDATFGPLVAALAAPDLPTDHGPCLTYGDLPEVIEARSATAFLIVHIPVDGCKHYQRDVINAISKARSA